MSTDLLLGWLMQADPTVALLVLYAVVAQLLYIAQRVLFGKSGKPAKRLVSILRAVAAICGARRR